MRFSLLLPVFLLPSLLLSQPERWQQKVRYEMDIDFDVKTHQFSGKQKLTYFNSSPDTLGRVFYHLYLNAFQPGSAMDVRSRTIADPDYRILDRISLLKPDETGYQKVLSLKHNGNPVLFHVEGTILEVKLDQPIPAGDSAVFEMEFEAQVPVQIRRNGRNNEEGIAYSMSQWYPKMCQYDYQGWHANPYIAREFYGIFGDFDITIRIDREYVVAATGYLQNPLEIGYGYEKEGDQVDRPKGEKLAWHFFAPQVNDFVWTADPDYQHTRLDREDGLVLHFFYQKTGPNQEEWKRLPPLMDKVFSYMNERFGQYPYRQFSFIQGGDGGMEYPMATLITGDRPLASLVGVSVHELAHAWYPMVIGTNESLYGWMDEGFSTYVSNEVMNFIRESGLMPGQTARENPHAPTYAGYLNLLKSGLEEPMITPSDHFQTSYAYGQASYDKGAVFLHQLSYVTGDEAFSKGLLDYYETWKFKHPNPSDFIRCMEKASGLELDWYKEYFLYTTYWTDYGIETLRSGGEKKSVLVLKRTGAIPMPVDVTVSTADGKSHVFSIPLDIMRGARPPAPGEAAFEVAPDWMWVKPTYELSLPYSVEQIRKIEIDPSLKMADVNRADNIKVFPSGTE